MTTKAAELKAEIAKLNLDIKISNEILARRKVSVEMWTKYIAQLKERLAALEPQLEHEKAATVKPI